MRASTSASSSPNLTIVACERDVRYVGHDRSFCLSCRWSMVFDFYGYKVIVTKIMFCFCLFLIGFAYIRWHRRWHIFTALLPFLYAFWLTVGLKYSPQGAHVIRSHCNLHEYFLWSLRKDILHYHPRNLPSRSGRLRCSISSFDKYLSLADTFPINALLSLQ